MNATTIIIATLITVAALLALWIAFIYNNLVRGRNACDESWADVDTELKRRYDLIPNLVETVKGYARHEREAMERVTRARATAAASHGSPGSQARDENALVDSLRRMFAVAEGYPDLKASSHFLELLNELVNTEDRIQRARRFYNGNVRDYNNMVEMFPSNIVAGAFKCRKREFFEIEAAIEREAPAVRIHGESE